jgi:oxygen-independent coproporphyrinogen-3 oxidase
LAEHYVKALANEIGFYSNKGFILDSKVSIAYFGGGTPTAIPINLLLEIFNTIKEKLPFDSPKEITVETHPSTTTLKYLSKLKELGVNRISIGIQSFNNKYLRLIGATHSSDEAKRALKYISNVGFEKIGIDLMYGLPKQSLNDWLNDLEMAISYDPTSVSIYRLTTMEGTPLHYKPLDQPSLDLEIEMYFRAKETLKDYGYKPYTVVDFAKSGKECLYVKHVWCAPQGEFLGVGAGAYSFINGYMLYNIANIEYYIKQTLNGNPPILLARKLNALEHMSRYFVLGVRCLKVDLGKFEEIYGLRADEIFKRAISKAVQLGLIKLDNSELTVTELGCIYIDNISKLFYTENNIGIPQPAGVAMKYLTPDILKQVKEMEDNI